MLIEIKDLPEGQLIEKLDLHIDFQKGITEVKTVPPTREPEKTEKEIPKEIPKEMTDIEF